MLISSRAALSPGATFANCDAHELIDAHDRVAHGPPHASAGALPPQPLTGASFASVGRSMRVEDGLLPTVACVIARISDETVSGVACPPGCCRAHSVPLPSSESWRRRTPENAADNRRTSRTVVQLNKTPAHYVGLSDSTNACTTLKSADSPAFVGQFLTRSVPLVPVFRRAPHRSSQTSSSMNSTLADHG